MNSSRQSSNLSKPGSRQKKVTKRQNVDVTDPEFAKAMEKQLSNLDKKNVSRTSSMAASMPRLGAPAVSSPKVTASPQPETLKQGEVVPDQNGEQKKAKKVKRRKKQENADNENDAAEYTDDFETDSDDDEISKVQSANATFVQAQFDEDMRALSRTSELPEVNEEEFDQYMDQQRQLLVERETTHTTWMEGFIQKKEQVMARLGIVSRKRTTNFHEVCGITCGLLGMPPFPKSNTAVSLIQSRSRSRERSRERSRGRSQERSRERSRARSRERSQGRSRERSREKTFEKPAIAEDKELPEIKDLKEELLGENDVAVEDKSNEQVNALNKEE